ncbi:MAG: CopG family transcriptional regulator [Rhizobiales bacterium]|nr:CopG family transcriptional regulator [Hyphomicrobiales bacterium]
MSSAGFEVSIADDPNLDARRESLKIPAELASCHIALAEGYAFEGHVPPADIVRFLNERPSDAIGLVVPGMPAGSPGMGPEGSGGPYDVLMLKANAALAVYASH